MESGDNSISAICTSCDKLTDKSEDDVNHNETINKCTRLLNCCHLDDDNNSSYPESVHSDGPSGATGDDNNAVDVFQNESVCLEDTIISTNNNEISWDNLINKKPHQYKNIQIYKSQNVHIGDVTNINGPIYINRFAPTLNQNIFITNTSKNTRNFPMVPRLTWLAQPPLDPDDVKPFPQPVKYVIICHTATEEAYTQTANNLIVRIIQQFHIESRAWNDIAYNFLIGAEGSAYEGRGWNTIGAHTLGYNTISICIAFIGCYMKKLPQPVALKKAQDLIRHGVEAGAIAKDYSLLGHCQCRSSENPGKRLFEEIKTWDRWDGSVSLENPSPLAIK